MAERQLQHDMESTGLCALCDQLLESIDDLIAFCIVSREVWFKIFRCSGWDALTPL
jgi:hypothetical protein